MGAATAKKYTAADITVLEGLEAVRKRPSMYIGGVDSRGLHHLLWEIIDNGIDEHLNGHGDSLTVVLHKSGDCATVTDNGRGIPVDKHPKFKKSALELILTTLHSGAKFGEGGSYIRSGGLHGVGSSVVNALSRSMVASVRRDGFNWEQSFERGVPSDKLAKKGPTRGSGTAIYFEPDPKIFKNTHFDPQLIRNRLEDMSYVHKGLKVKFTNEISGETFDLTHTGGLPEFLGRLLKEGEKPAVTEPIFSYERPEGDRIEVALQWTQSTNETIRSYVNGIRTSSGGTHESGFKSAIVKAVRNYMGTHDIKVKGLTIAAEDIREGVVGILSVFVQEPLFQGQTKERLNNEEMTSVVDGAVRPALEGWLNANRTAADAIIGRIVLAARIRAASREAASEVKRKSATSRRLNLPGKLADCKSSKLSESELFVVEGDSAGGSAKQGRDNRIQAVLPLRGKILNAEGASLTRVMNNNELSDLVSAIGTGAGTKFDLSGLRYGKIILLMDADADGFHITTLMLGFLFRHMPDLIHKGHVYLAQPPLYRIDVGKETFWARDDQHKEEILEGLRANAKPEVSRFKGLGEMDPKVLKETTLDPKLRTLLKVQVESNLETDQVLVTLLGNQPAERYKFLMDSAQLAGVDDLDV